MTVGSPVFRSYEECDKAVKEFGAMLVMSKFPGYSLINYRCVSLVDEKA